MCAVILIAANTFASDSTNPPPAIACQTVKAETPKYEVLGVETPEKVKIFQSCIAGDERAEFTSKRISDWLTEQKGKIRLTSKPDISAHANGNYIVIVYHYVELPREAEAPEIKKPN